MDLKLTMCLLDWINLDKIWWPDLSANSSEGAIQLLEKIQIN